MLYWWIWLGALDKRQAGCWQEGRSVRLLHIWTTNPLSLSFNIGLPRYSSSRGCRVGEDSNECELASPLDPSPGGRRDLGHACMVSF